MIETKDGERAYWAIIVMFLIIVSPWVAHMWRNAYLDLFTERTPVPVLLTGKVAPYLEVYAVPENDIGKTSEDLYITIKNNSPIPVWKVSLDCTVVYANDSNGPREVEAVLFMEDPIMPGQSKTGVGRVFTGAGTGSAGCRIKRVETPISWWDGIPPEMGF